MDSNLSRFAGVSGAGARRRNPERSEGPQRRVLERGNGRPEWTRTIDLFRVNSPNDDGTNDKE
jgi:hypothetical protein